MGRPTLGNPGRQTRQDSSRTVRVFGVALPKDNLFDFLGFPCAQGIYSPAVDDGYYVLLKKLDAGSHIVHIHAEIPSSDFVTDVTYHLTVVPLNLK